MRKDEDLQSQDHASTANNAEQDKQAIDASAGAILKKARKAKGLTIEDIATQLKLKTEIIQQLESDSLDDNLHTPTFVRGYICSYAKLIGIEVDDVVAIYDKKHNAKLSYDVHIQSFSQETKIKTSNSRITVVTWGLIMCLLVLSVGWWWQNREETVLTDIEAIDVVIQEESSDKTAHQVLTVVDKNQDVEEKVVEGIQEEPVVQATESTEVKKAEEKAPEVKKEDTKKEIVKATPQTEQTSIVSKNTGHIVFNGDCWINIRGADGKSLINGVRKAGTSVDFTGVAPFKVVLGAPSNVTLTYEGKEVDLSTFSKKGKVARLTLGE